MSNQTTKVEQKESVLSYIQKLNCTAQRCAQLQEQNYRFHLQHHNNIKKMMVAINRLADILSTRFDTQILQVELDEDPLLLNVSLPSAKHSPVIDISNRKPIVINTFHDLVMSFSNDPISSELAAHLRGTTQEQFFELQEESMNVILPMIATWLQSPDEEDQKMAMVYLWEATLKFPTLFHRAKNRKLIAKFKEGVATLDVSSIEKHGVTEDEFKTLCSFLAKCG